MQELEKVFTLLGPFKFPGVDRIRKRALKSILKSILHKNGDIIAK